MPWPANDSPLWPILRVTIRQCVLLVGLLVFYKSGLELPDLKTLLLCVFADAGITTLAHKSGEK